MNSWGGDVKKAYGRGDRGTNIVIGFTGFFMFNLFEVGEDPRTWC